MLVLVLVLGAGASPVVVVVVGSLCSRLPHVLNSTLHDCCDVCVCDVPVMCMCAP